MAEMLAMKLASKLRQASSQRRILGLTNPTQKVCAELWLMLETQAQIAQGSTVAVAVALAANANTNARIAQMPTHQELAIMINASRETVTRVFQQLLLKNVVQRDGNDLVILKPELIKEVALGLKSFEA